MRHTIRENTLTIFQPPYIFFLIKLRTINAKHAEPTTICIGPMINPNGPSNIILSMIGAKNVTNGICRSMIVERSVDSSLDSYLGVVSRVANSWCDSLFGFCISGESLGIARAGFGLFALASFIISSMLLIG